MIQNLILFAVLAVAALYIGRRAWRATRAAVKPDAGCASGCGCSAPAAPAKLERKPAAR